MVFWQGILVLALLATVFILWPVFKLPFKHVAKTNLIRHDVTQVELYEEHLADMDRALARKEIDSEQYQALKIELQRTLVLESDGLGEVKTRHGGKLLILGVALLAPVIAVLLYSQWGAKQDLDIYTYLQAERANPPANQTELEQSSRQLLLDVQARLKQKPNNYELRYLFAERSFELKNYDEAIAAYKTLLDAQPNSPTIAIRLAQTFFVRAGNKVVPEVAHYADIAVKGAPFMYPALEMSGLVAFSNNDYRNAILFWQRAKQQLDANSRSAQALDGAINKAAAAAVKAGVDVTVTAEAKPAQTDNGESDQGFDVDVSLAEGVSADASDTVFVYAREVGGKMPLAIARFTVADLPKVIRLDNSMAMAPGMNMASVKQLELVARISKAGSPVPQSGDWQALSEAVTLSESGITAKTLIIATQLP